MVELLERHSRRRRRRCHVCCSEIPSTVELLVLMREYVIRLVHSRGFYVPYSPQQLQSQPQTWLGGKLVLLPRERSNMVSRFLLKYMKN